MKWTPLKKLVTAMVILSYTAIMASPVLAADTETTESIDSKSIKLAEVVGEVTIEKGTKVIPTKNEMRLFDGWIVSTGKDSHAFLELDDSKFVKVDQYTKIKVSKEKKTNNISVLSGALFFNVTSPLEDDEAMNVRTSTITMGIRGTSGGVQELADENGRIVALGQVYSGETKIENRTNGKSIGVPAGKQYVNKGNPRSGFSEEAQNKMSTDGSDTIGVALSSITNDEALLREILDNGWLKDSDYSSYEQALQALKQASAKKESADIQRVDEIIEILEEAKKKYEETHKEDVGFRDYEIPGGSTPDQPLPDKSELSDVTTSSSRSSSGNSSEDETTASVTSPSQPPAASQITSPPYTVPAPAPDPSP